MSKSNAFETAIQKLIFQNIAAANIGDAGGLQPSATAGFLYIALHTSDPGETGDQTTNECSFTGYARIPVPRSTAGFTESNGTITNAALVTFLACTAGSATVTHFSIGTALSGAGVRLESGALTASLIINPGIAPEFAIGALSSAED